MSDELLAKARAFGEREHQRRIRLMRVSYIGLWCMMGWGFTDAAWGAVVGGEP